MMTTRVAPQLRRLPLVHPQIPIVSRRAAPVASPCLRTNFSRKVTVRPHPSLAFYLSILTDSLLFVGYGNPGGQPVQKHQARHRQEQDSQPESDDNSNEPASNLRRHSARLQGRFHHYNWMPFLRQFFCNSGHKQSESVRQSPRGQSTNSKPGAHAPRLGGASQPQSSARSTASRKSAQNPGPLPSVSKSRGSGTSQTEHNDNVQG